MSRLAVPRQLSPHLFIIYAESPHRDSGNVYLLTGSVPTLIDCGSSRGVPQMRRNLSQLGIDIQDIGQVIATHGDCDHIQGYHDLRQENPALSLHLHPADWSLAEEPNPYRNANYIYRNPFVPIDVGHCLPLGDGQQIEAGEGALTVLHTPGHTEGSISLWGEIDGHKVVFAGDTVGGSMRSLTGADLGIWAQALRTWEESLQRVAGLEIDWILTGHEPAHSLPLSRAWFDRARETFGKMMNPWFLLGERFDDEPPQPEDMPDTDSRADRPADIVGL
jgi:glyoxylase-like metal-dependent hydrolase (beta-lactamase superfamily II)